MKTAKEAARDKEQLLRQLMREKFGAGKYRIEKGGLVSVYGRAPNSIEVCWWMFGADVEDALYKLGK